MKKKIRLLPSKNLLLNTLSVLILSLITTGAIIYVLKNPVDTSNAQSTPNSYWNVERDASNNLNFSFTNNNTPGAIGFQLQSNGAINAIGPVTATNAIVVKQGLIPSTVGSDSGLTGSRLYQFGYQEAGAWTTPFPDLVLGYHTGIKMGANTGYGGVKFFADHPSVNSTQLFSVGDGDTNVRVANWLMFPNAGYGLHSPNNNARFYPNNGTYGSWRVAGNRNGWGGLEFDTSAGQTTLMVGHPSYTTYGTQYTGMHLNGTGWLWYSYGPNLYSSSFRDMDNGAYEINPASTSTTYVLRRAYGYNGYEYDENNSGYYVDPSYVSQFSYLYRTYGFNGPEYDANNTGYYVDPNGTSSFVDLRSSYMYDNNNTAYYIDMDNTSMFNDLRANRFYDRNNPGYYALPSGQSRMNNIWLDYMSCMSSWCPQNYVMRLTPNLHMNSVAGYAMYVNWDNGHHTGLQFSVGNGAGSHMFHVRGDGYAEVAGHMRINATLGLNGYGPQGCGGYGLCVGGAAYSQGGWQGSDIRLKKDITPITGALDKILKLDGVTYRLKDESKDPGTLGGKHFGFIAQQVEDTIPEAVSTNPDGYRAMEYAPLTALLTEGIKEQQTQIEDLKKENEKQQQELELLRKELNELKAAVQAKP